MLSMIGLFLIYISILVLGGLMLGGAFGYASVVCIAFAVTFWLGVLALLVGLVTGGVMGAQAGRWKMFWRCLGVGAMVFLFAMICAVVFLIFSSFVEAARSIGEIAGFTDESAILLRHLFFPWERF